MFKKVLCFLLGGHSYNGDSCINYEYPDGAIKTVPGNEDLNGTVLVQWTGHCRFCRYPSFALRFYGLE